jgi:hypothetical protein
MKDSLRILFVRRANSALISLFVFIFGIGCSFAQSTDPANSAGNSGTEPSAKESAITWDNGMHICSRNGLAELEIGGMVQADERSFAGPHPPSKLPDFILRRGRLVLLGTSLKRLNFRIMAESQRNGPMVVRDAYVDIKISDGIQIELGKFKSPVGLERLQSARYLTFPDRASVTALIPDRDIGIQLHGDLLKSRVTYMGGLFRGVPDGGSTETSTNHGADGEFRIFTYPFHGARASLFGGLGIGIGVSAGSERGTLPSYVTPGLATFFSYRQGTIADGERTRISPQASYYWRRLSVMAEYALSAQDVRLGGIVQRVSNTPRTPASLRPIRSIRPLTNGEPSKLQGDPIRSESIHLRFQFLPIRQPWVRKPMGLRWASTGIRKNILKPCSIMLKPSSSSAPRWEIGLQRKFLSSVFSSATTEIWVDCSRHAVISGLAFRCISLLFFFERLALLERETRALGTRPSVVRQAKLTERY